MNDDTITPIRSSWQKVEAIAPAAAALFYSNLFAADPRLRPLFKGDMQQQGDKLMQMIGAAVGKLDDLPDLVPALQGLAQRHAGYGVQAAHYDTVGAALLRTLDEGLGDDFSLSRARRMARGLQHDCRGHAERRTPIRRRARPAGCCRVGRDAP